MAKTIELKAASLAEGETAKLRDFTYTPSGGSATTVKALLTADVTIPAAAGGIPAGYEEETVNILTDAGILTRTVLVKTSTKASVETFGSSDSRLLLAIDSSGVVRKSRGYLKG